MLRSRIVPYVLLCAALTACNPDKDDGGTDDGATGPGESTDGESATDDGVTTGAPAECDLPGGGEAVCGLVEVTCDGDEALADSNTLACALAAMRDRTPGRVSMSRCENVGQNVYHYVWELRADGSARRMHDAQVDFCSLDGEVLEIELAAPADYADCLGFTDWQAQVDCLTEGTVVGVCDPGESECSDGV